MQKILLVFILAALVKRSIECVEILAVEVVGSYTQTFAETLIMNNFPCTQKSYRVDNIGVVTKTQDIIVCGSCFLFGCKVFVEVGQNIAFRLHRCSGVRSTCRRRRIYSGGMVNEVSVHSGFFYLLGGQVLRQLIDYRTDHFKMCKLFRAYVGEYRFKFRVRHCVALAEVAERSSEFAVGSSVL